METILISGINGFIGSSLSKYLQTQGYNVMGLTRKDFNLDDEAFSSKLKKADIIINLAGAPITGRWTKKYKAEIYNSRILTTGKIVNCIISHNIKPKLFISASAVGIYDDKGMKNEKDTVSPDDFLKKLCIDWEHEAQKATTQSKVAITRLGVVLDKKGGALRKMLPLFSLGLGGKIGNGKQIMSWIHLQDLLRAFHFIIENKESGVFNLTAPQPLSNKDFTKTLSKIKGIPALFTVPVMALKILYGEGAIILTSSQNVIPVKLLNSGFIFHYPDLIGALTNII